MTSEERQVRWRALGIAAVVAFLVFSYHAGEDSYVRINDNLDGLVPYYSLLAREGAFGPLDQRMPALLDGLPRNALPSALHLGMLPYLCLEPFQAYVVHDLFIRLIAYLGMLALLKRHLLPSGAAFVVHGAALCFALLPFLHASHLSVAGQPWLLSALLSLRRGRGDVWDWLALFVFPLYSSLVYIGLYVLAGLGGWIAWQTFRQRRVPAALVGALLCMTVLYIVSEYRLLHLSLVEEGYVSQRVEFDLRGSPFHWVFWIAFKNFFLSQNHAAALQLPFLLGGVTLALTLAVRDAFRANRLGALLTSPFRPSAAGSEPARSLLLALGCSALLALGVGFYNWKLVQLWIQDSLPVLRMFNAQRFQWFHPALFGVAFAFSLEMLRRRWRAGTAVVGALLVAQLGWVVWNSDALRVRREFGLTYREFYSPELFREIRAFIGRPVEDYRVTSFGLIPSIPLQNGFYVLDGLLGNYPLEYKRAFRRVIADELARDPWLENHYDHWGAHVHLYSTELGMVVGYRKSGPYTKDQPVRAVERVEIDTAALRAMGGEYVLAAVSIGNHAELGLRLLGTFRRNDSPWEIFLYAVEPDDVAGR